MATTVRFWAGTALAIAVAILLVVGMFGDDLQRAHQACVERGGHVVIESDPQSIGQFCVLPSGERVPL